MKVVATVVQSSVSTSGEPASPDSDRLASLQDVEGAVRCWRWHAGFLEEPAQPFKTTDPRSKPTSIFCRPALVAPSMADSGVGKVSGK